PGTALPAACFVWTEIYVMNADGTNVQRLTNNADIDRFPIFSPDGSKIVFTRGPTPVLTDIWVMNADGSDRPRSPIDPAGTRSRTGRRMERGSPGARPPSSTPRSATSGS
ncbi:MAG: TolB family protein, partial [Actinomycetes bacterium]